MGRGGAILLTARDFPKKAATRPDTREVTA
jgi:hypothetical protein